MPQLTVRPSVRFLGQMVAAKLAFLVFFISLVPALAYAILWLAPQIGHPIHVMWPALPLAELEHAAAILAAGLLLGAAAAWGLWGAPKIVRLLVLGAALLTLLMPRLWVQAGLYHSALSPLTPWADPIVKIAALACLTLTAYLNGLDPRLLQSAAACGASPTQQARLVLAPHLLWPTCLAALLAVTLLPP